MAWFNAITLKFVTRIFLQERYRPFPIVFYSQKKKSDMLLKGRIQGFLNKCHLDALLPPLVSRLQVKATVDATLIGSV